MTYSWKNIFISQCSQAT